MTQKDKPYQQLKAELDKIIGRLESENLDIDDASKLYEEARKLISETEKHIKSVQAKINKINSKT